MHFLLLRQSLDTWTLVDTTFRIVYVRKITSFVIREMLSTSVHVSRWTVLFDKIAVF